LYSKSLKLDCQNSTEAPKGVLNAGSTAIGKRDIQTQSKGEGVELLHSHVTEGERGNNRSQTKGGKSSLRGGELGGQRRGTFGTAEGRQGEGVTGVLNSGGSGKVHLARKGRRLGGCVLGKSVPEKLNSSIVIIKWYPE